MQTVSLKPYPSPEAEFYLRKTTNLQLDLVEDSDDRSSQTRFGYFAITPNLPNTGV
jgi:hypothetical protein